MLAGHEQQGEDRDRERSAEPGGDPLAGRGAAEPEAELLEGARRFLLDALASLALASVARAPARLLLDFPFDDPVAAAVAPDRLIADSSVPR